LVQVYSALIFEGPELIKNINTGLIELIKADGYSSITQAIGAAR
jgi:dihydroorotate dehydrogenase